MNVNSISCNATNQAFAPYDNSTTVHDGLVTFRKLLFSSQLFDDLSIYRGEN